MSQFGYLNVLRSWAFYVGFAAGLKRRQAEPRVGEVESMLK